MRCHTQTVVSCTAPCLGRRRRPGPGTERWCRCLQCNSYTPYFPLTLSSPIPLRLHTLPYWSNSPFLIFDIRALWRSGLSARAPECQKLKMVRQTNMALNPANGSNFEQLALKGLKIYDATFFRLADQWVTGLEWAVVSSGCTYQQSHIHLAKLTVNCNDEHELFFQTHFAVVMDSVQQKSKTYKPDDNWVRITPLKPSYKTSRPYK